MAKGAGVVKCPNILADEKSHEAATSGVTGRSVHETLLQHQMRMLK